MIHPDDLARIREMSDKAHDASTAAGVRVRKVVHAAGSKVGMVLLVTVFGLLAGVYGFLRGALSGRAQ